MIPELSLCAYKIRPLSMYNPRIKITTFSCFSVGCCIIERRLSVTNLSSENNLPMFRLNAPVVIRVKVGKVFSELKLVTDNLRNNLGLVIKGRQKPEGASHTYLHFQWAPDRIQICW